MIQGVPQMWADIYFISQIYVSFYHKFISVYRIDLCMYFGHRAQSQIRKDFEREQKKKDFFFIVGYMKYIIGYYLVFAGKKMVPKKKSDVSKSSASDFSFRFIVVVANII